MHDTRNKTKLVIFDCDGVLVDSEPIASRIFCEMLNNIGLSISYDQTVQYFEGRSDSDCKKIVENMLGKPLPDNFFSIYDHRIYDAFAKELQPVKNITAVLDAISIPVCVASSGPHAKMRVTLSQTGLLPIFEDRIFSATDVDRGKPYPDLFLYTAQQMGVSPESCVVVEDSVYGVQAGIAAGMTVLGYAARSDSDTLAAAGAQVFDNMLELPKLLKRFEICEDDNFTSQSLS